MSKRGPSACRSSSTRSRFRRVSDSTITISSTPPSLSRPRIRRTFAWMSRMRVSASTPISWSWSLRSRSQDRRSPGTGNGTSATTLTCEESSVRKRAISSWCPRSTTESPISNRLADSSRPRSEATVEISTMDGPSLPSFSKRQYLVCDQPRFAAIARWLISAPMRSPRSSSKSLRSSCCPRRRPRSKRDSRVPIGCHSGRAESSHTSLRLARALLRFDEALPASTQLRRLRSRPPLPRAAVSVSSVGRVTDTACHCGSRKAPGRLSMR